MVRCQGNTVSAQTVIDVDEPFDRIVDALMPSAQVPRLTVSYDPVKCHFWGGLVNVMGGLRLEESEWTWECVERVLADARVSFQPPQGLPELQSPMPPELPSRLPLPRLPRTWWQQSF